MFLRAQILVLYAESAVYAGTGSGLGAVDLPIQRERTTGYPIIQASSVKGALRSHVASAAAHKDIERIFGPEKPEYAGAVSPGDARILLFPVRALRGVFVWVTSADVLWRFRRDVLMTGETEGMPGKLPATDQRALVSDRSLLLDGNTILLEEFSFEAGLDTLTQKWAAYFADHAMPQEPEYQYWQQRLKSSLVALPEDAFRDFVRYATETVTRIRLSSETKTVESGALFTQELLPADTVLYSPVQATRWRTGESYKEKHEQQAEAALKWVRDYVARDTGERIQIGGDETVGRGIVRLQWLGA